MDESFNLINDVLSGDDDVLQSVASDNSDGDSTLVSHDDALLTSLLSETENIVRSFSNLSLFQNNVADDKKFERKIWENSNSKKSGPSTYNHIKKPIETSRYYNSETDVNAKPSSVIFRPTDVQTFSDTSSLLQTLQSELIKRTSELHETENEYFNLKASYENMSSRFDMINTDLSTLRTQSLSKDKQIKQMQQKIISLESNTTRLKGEYDKIYLELDKSRGNLEESKQSHEEKLETLSQEIRKREGVIEELRSELTQTVRSSHKPPDTANLLKEKVLLLEKALKQKEQQIQSFQRERSELERINQSLVEENEKFSKTKSLIDNLEEENELLKEQLENSNKKNESLNETLANSKRFYDESREHSEKNVKDQLNKIEKLKQEYKELEAKHKDCVTTLKQQGDKYQNIIKEMKDKKEHETQKLELDKRNHILVLENAELTKKIENLQSQLIEASISESNLNKSIKNEHESRQNYIDQLSQETIQLNRVIDDLKDKLRIRDSTIEKLNEQMVELNLAKDDETKIVRDLEEQSYSYTYKIKILENDIKEKTQQMEILDLELTNNKEQNEKLFEEFRKINGEKRDLERSHKRLEDKYIQEIRDTEDQLQVAKSEITKLNVIINNEKESNHRITCENEKLLKDLNSLKIKNSEYCEELDDKKISLDEYVEKEKRLQNHNQYLEGELATIKLEFEDTSEELERMKNAWNNREDVLESCRNEAKKQQENNVNLIQKIEQRDELLQRLTTETTKLKQKYQEKNIEFVKLKKENDSIRKNITDLENSIKELQQKSDVMLKKKESAMEQLKEQLTASQNQYSSCYETLLKKDDHLSRFQMMEKEHLTKIGELQKEISRMQSDYDEMEGELNMMRAKYRACQEELNHRDEQLLGMKNDSKRDQQDIYDLQSEKLLSQNEADRWKGKFMELQSQFEDQAAEYENLEDKISEKDQQNDELNGKLQIALQKIENNERTIDQLKIDINMSKSTNSERYNHFKTIITSLKNEIENKNQENKLIEDKCNNLKSQIAKSKEEKDNYHQDILTLKHEIEISQEKLRLKESECQHWMQQTQKAQYLNEESKLSQNSLSKELTMMKQQMEAKESKIQSNTNTIMKLKEEKNENYKKLLDYKSQLESVVKDRDEIVKLYEENNAKLRKYEQCVKEMNEELSTAQVEICNYTGVISRLESDLSHLTTDCSQKQMSIEEMECKIAKLKSNHLSYKNQFKTSEEEVENLNSLLLQQAKKCSELENNFSIKISERDQIIKEKEKIENKLSQLQKGTELEMKRKDEELEKIKFDKEEKIKSLEEKQQKYHQEIKKLKSYLKQVEIELSNSNRTIEDLHNEIELKHEQLEMMVKKYESVEELLDQRNKETNQMQMKLVAIENEIKIYRSQREKDWDKSPILQKELDNIQSELKEKTNKILELANECTKFQTKSCGLENELEKTEKKMLQYESECKRLQSAVLRYEKEMNDVRSQQCNQAEVLEKTKGQYEKFFSEFNAVKEEYKKEKKLNSQLTADIEKLQIQLFGRIEHQKLLEEQISQQETLFSELHKEILQERQKSEISRKDEIENRKTMYNIENETENLSQSKYELQLKLKEKERQHSILQLEFERSNQRCQQLTEIVMEKENKIKILDKRLQCSEDEITRMNENMKQIENANNPSETESDRTDRSFQLQASLEASEKQVSQLRSQIQELHNENSKLSVKCQIQEDEIRTIKNQKDKIRIKLSELTTNKEEPAVINKRIQSLTEENESLQRMNKKLKYELEEKDQMLIKNNEDSMKSLTQKLVRCQNNEMISETQLEEMRHELKYRSDQLEILRSKFEKTRSENEALDCELKKCRDMIENLKNENERIVDNFNSWIQEQKLANEKLGDKIRDQNRTIQELKKQNGNLEKEKMKVYKEFQDLKNNPMDFETVDKEQMKQKDIKIKEKCLIIKNLEYRLSEQNDKIESLKKQIEISRRNPKRSMSEEEKRIPYQDLQSDAYALKNSMNAGKNNLKGSKILSEGSLNSKESDSSSFDKQYWIRRVGELSEELQNTKEYWSEKLKQLSNNQESSTATEEITSTESV